MSDYLGYVGNFTVAGAEMTKNPDGCLLRDVVRFNADGIELIFRQLPEVIKDYSRNQPRGRFVDTSRVTVINVGAEELDQVHSIVRRVAELLSFSTESRVCFYGHDYPAGGNIGERHTVIGTVQHWRPPFQTANEIKQFVDACYPRYIALRESRKLNIVTDYIYHCAMRNLALEGSLTLTFVLLENLRHTFVAAKPAVNGVPASKGTLFNDLTEMFAEFGMTPDVRRIVDTRNELIHEGVLTTAGDHNWEAFELCQTEIREYFLRLLGYTGPYMGYDLVHRSC
jgi:hypothetical protein